MDVPNYRKRTGRDDDDDDMYDGDDMNEQDQMGYKRHNTDLQEDNTLNVLDVWNQPLQDAPRKRSSSESDDFVQLYQKRGSPEIQPDLHELHQQNMFEYRKNQQERFIAERLNQLGCINKDDQQRFYDPLTNMQITRLNNLYTLRGYSQFNNEPVMLCFDLLTLAKHIIQLGVEHQLKSPEHIPDDQPYMHFNTRGYLFNITVGTLKDIVHRYTIAIGIRSM